MFGFFTLVSLVVAYTLGGWWWAGFAVMFLAWLGKRQEAKEKREAAGRVEELEDQAEEIARETADWPEALVEACSSLVAHGYYVGDLIPEKKRSNAMLNFPPPGNPMIFALVDGTVFGSADRGLAVGRDGLAWKDFGKENPVQMTWDFLAQRQVALSGGKVTIGLLEYEGTGSGIAPEKLETLFASLHDYAQSVAALGPKQSQRHVDVPKKSPEVVDATKPVVAINSAEFDELLALPGIGAAEAQMILKRRSERAFSSNTELADYLDLKPHIVTKLDGLTDFGPAAGALLPETEPTKSTVANAPRLNTLGGRTID